MTCTLMNYSFCNPSVQLAANQTQFTAYHISLRIPLLPQTKHSHLSGSLYSLVTLQIDVHNNLQLVATDTSMYTIQASHMDSQL